MKTFILGLTRLKLWEFVWLRIKAFGVFGAITYYTTSTIATYARLRVKQIIAF